MKMASALGGLNYGKKWLLFSLWQWVNQSAPRHFSERELGLPNLLTVRVQFTQEPILLGLLSFFEHPMMDHWWILDLQLLTYCTIGRIVGPQHFQCWGYVWVFGTPFKPCHVGIHSTAQSEYSQMSTHVPGFQSFSGVLHYFVSAQLATSRIKGLIVLAMQKPT